MRLKSMCCATAAVLAIAGLQASAASAGSYECQEGVGATCTITGSNSGLGAHKIFFGSIEFKCEEVGGKAMFTNGDKSVTTSEITYGKCKTAAFGQSATVKMEGCDYNFGEPTGSVSPFTIKAITITCPTGKEIVLNWASAGCTIKIGSQTTVGTSTATNVAGPPMTGTFNAAITGIKYTSSGGICGTAGTFSTGKYEGSIVIKGFSDEVHTKATGVTVKPEARLGLNRHERHRARRFRVLCL